MTLQLPVGLIEKARDVVFFSPGLTMASFMEQASFHYLSPRTHEGQRARRATQMLIWPKRFEVSGSPVAASPRS